MQYLVDRNEGIYWTQGRERVKFQHTIKHLYIYVNFSSLVLKNTLRSLHRVQGISYEFNLSLGFWKFINSYILVYKFVDGGEFLGHALVSIPRDITLHIVAISELVSIWVNL